MSDKIPLISLLVTEPLFDGTEDVITQIPIDARISSTYSFRAEVTQFPVESGATVTDHVHTRPDEITLEGMVSDSGLVEFPSLLGLRGDGELQQPGTRRQTAFDAIFRAFTDKTPLTVVTEYLIFDDMVIESFDVPKSPERGEAIWFNMTLRKISTVKTLTSSLPPEVVARLKRRRAKVEARRRANRKAPKNDAQTSEEAKRGKVSTSPAVEAYSSAASAAAKGFKG
jgi:hypothetical protein